MADTPNMMTWPTPAEAQKKAFNASGPSRVSLKPVTPLPGERWANMWVQLHPDVTPGDYAALKADIVAITGIQDIKLGTDMPVLPALVDDEAHHFLLVGEANVQIRDIPAE